jgi:aryl-alcohol dehydrogenase-like predicted oxidoreductase
VVVVSKAGYIQGELYIKSQSRKKQNQPIPELVEYGKGLEHCIHPEFLSDQLTQSLSRIDLTYLDVYLLHNPEYFLMYQQMNGVPVSEAREQFYARIEKAFIYLESEVKYGRIRYYGVSSNTLVKSPDDYDYVDMQRLSQIANNISKTNHFKVIQFPLNILEPNIETLELANQLYLGILTNRPFNALVNQKMFRLVDFISESPPSSIEIDDCIQDLIRLESSFTEFEYENQTLTESEQKLLESRLCLGTQLDSYWREFSGVEHWKDVLSSYFLPHVEQCLLTLNQHLTLNPADLDWIEQYFGLFNQTAKYISDYYQSVSATRSDQIKSIISQHIPQWKHALTLSQLAIKSLRELPGLSCVLIGMRNEDYVNDVLIELYQSPPEQHLKNWETLSEAINEISKL